MNKTVKNHECDDTPLANMAWRPEEDAIRESSPAPSAFVPFFVLLSACSNNLY